MNDPAPDTAGPHGHDRPATVPSRRAQLGPIVLGTDLEDISRAPEEAAIVLAAATGMDLLIVHALDPGRLRLPGGRFVRRIDQVRAAHEGQLASVVSRARAAGVDARALVWVGSAADCILEAARAEGAARIIVGSHRRGRLGRLLAGSVAGDVFAGAPCPVDVVFPGSTPAIRHSGVPADQADRHAGTSRSQTYGEDVKNRTRTAAEAAAGPTGGTR